MKRIFVLSAALLLGGCSTSAKVAYFGLPSPAFLQGVKAETFHNDGPETTVLLGGPLAGPRSVAPGQSVRLTWDNGYRSEIVK